MPKAETVQAFMKHERTRLQKARDKAAQKKAKVDRELEALERELTAIEAYDKATRGKAKRAPKRARSRRGEKRQAVLDVWAFTLWIRPEVRTCASCAVSLFPITHLRAGRARTV
jgi:hypothetical protein